MCEVWSLPCQLFGGEPDFFSDFVSDATQVPKAHAIHCQQLTCTVHTHPLQHILGFE